jgi:hypothetical protein
MKRKSFRFEAKKDVFSLVLLRSKKLEIISEMKMNKAKQAKPKENEPKYFENIGGVLVFIDCLEH